MRGMSIGKVGNSTYPAPGTVQISTILQQKVLYFTKPIYNLAELCTIKQTYIIFTLLYFTKLIHNLAEFCSN
jgi:hypothetical protein